jgi:hypothetical protein
MLYAAQTELARGERAVSQDLVRLYEALGDGWGHDTARPQVTPSPWPISSRSTRYERPLQDLRRFQLVRVDDPRSRECAPDAPPHWATYVTVEDVDATARKAEALGAKTLVPPTDIRKVGRFCMLQDPQGAVIAAITYVKES